MSHEDVLNHSQEQPSTPPTAASLPGPSPAGKHSRLVWFLMIPVALCVFGLFTWFSKSRTQTALAASTQASAAEPCRRSPSHRSMLAPVDMSRTGTQI